MSQFNITMLNTEKLEVQCEETLVSLCDSISMLGKLECQPWSGAWDINEYDHPSYFKVKFQFYHKDIQYHYEGTAGLRQLKAPQFTQTISPPSGFIDHSGLIENQADCRSDWNYILPDGTVITNRLKYTGFKFRLMFLEKTFLVHCNYYDQSNFQCYRDIYYYLPYNRLVLQNADSFYYSENGDLDDWCANDHGEIRVTTHA